MQNFDLIIVGGGLAGASLAVALRTSPLRIALVEGQLPQRHTGEDWDARIYAISPANQAFLTDIGCWPHLDTTRLQDIQTMDVRGDAGGHLVFSAAETGVENLGWILESSLMACELWETVKRQANVTLFCPAKPQALRFGVDAAELTLNDGLVLSAKLVVGADGRDSWVRAQASLVEHTSHYGQKGLVANFKTEKPHQQVAHQWFRKDGILAYLPLPGNRMSIVWSTADAHADELVDLAARDPSAFCARVAEAGEFSLGDLELLTAPLAFPLRLIKVPDIVDHRVALVGDAAHGIHPLSGHGINLGFGDARVLAAQLLAATEGQDIGEVCWLKRYQRARKEEVLLTQTTTDLLQKLFTLDLPAFPNFLPGLRNGGLNLTNALPPVKNLLVRYALGTHPGFF